MTAIDLMERTHALLAAGQSIYAARQTGLYQFGAAGPAQRLQLRGLPAGDLPILALAIDSATGDMLAGIHGGVARSADAGGSWQAIAFRAPPPLVTCLAPLPEAETGAILAGTYEDGVFRSSDGGKSWRASNHGLFDHSVNCLALAPPGNVYAGVSSGIYHSENGGKLWRDLRMPAGDEMVLSLALSPTGEEIYAGTEAHGLLHSSDRGQTWAALLNADGAVNGLALTADAALIAQVDDAVLRSSRAGAQWIMLADAGVDCFMLDDNGRQLTLALSDGSLRRVAL